MSKEQLTIFLDAVNTCCARQEKLKDAAEPDAVAAIAQSAGYGSVSAELVSNFLEHVAAQSGSTEEMELELSAVSGGLKACTIASIASGAIAGAAVIATSSYLAYKKQSVYVFQKPNADLHHDLLSDFDSYQRTRTDKKFDVRFPDDLSIYL